MENAHYVHQSIYVKMIKYNTVTLDYIWFQAYALAKSINATQEQAVRRCCKLVLTLLGFFEVEAL